MRRLAVVVAALAILATPAAADDDDDEGSRNNRNRNGNDCVKAEAHCEDNDFSPSPSFDKSPVEDSFNIQVCVTPGSCIGGEEEA